VPSLKKDRKQENHCSGDLVCKQRKAHEPQLIYAKVPESTDKNPVVKCVEFKAVQTLVKPVSSGAVPPSPSTASDKEALG
jgi:hypothetical protein